jgi:hypothetical protein
MNRVELKEVDKFIGQKDNPGAIINIDTSGKDAYINARMARLENQKKLNEINTIKQDVDNLKSDISDIKLMLKEILERK